MLHVILKKKLLIKKKRNRTLWKTIKLIKPIWSNQYYIWTKEQWSRLVESSYMAMESLMRTNGSSTILIEANHPGRTGTIHLSKLKW